MSRLIFVNHNIYDVFVPTPNGAGRRVKVGQAVEGDYFIDIANTGMLSRYSGDPANVEIICECRLNSYLQASVSATAALKRETAAAKVTPEVTPEVTIVPEPVEVVVTEEVAPVVEPTVVLSSPLTPSEKDLFALSMDELRMIAATMGIDADINLKKKSLVKMINANKK